MLEMQAIKNVFCEGRSFETPLVLGTSKPNIGHSEAAGELNFHIELPYSRRVAQDPENVMCQELQSKSFSFSI